MKKYELTTETKRAFGTILYRIKALKDFEDVKKGELGGWVEKEGNLSQDGNCWIYNNARVQGNAIVQGNAVVCNDARVKGYAIVCSDAIVCNDADYLVFHNTWSSGRYFTWTRSNDMWKVGCFCGTGQKLVEKAFKDSEESGEKYKAYVDLVEKIKK